MRLHIWRGRRRVDLTSGTEWGGFLLPHEAPCSWLALLCTSPLLGVLYMSFSTIYYMLRMKDVFLGAFSPFKVAYGSCLLVVPWRVILRAVVRHCSRLGGIS